MATRSQRRKAKQKQKRKKKKNPQQERQGDSRQQNQTASGGNTRHQQRVLRQVPHPWPGETPEDAAVCDDSVLVKFDPELIHQILAVREALQLACDSRGEEAVERVSGIARSSPLSEWRLFVRGLTAWLAGDFDTAGEAWKRLDFDRRPGRIATAMMNALRTDLQDASATKSAEEGDGAFPGDWAGRLDDQLLYHAKLLRRVRFERAAIKIAETGVRVPEESTELVLGPRKIRWLKRFMAEYRETEPDLVAALEHAALGRAFAQDFIDMFEEAVRTFQGPRHDRRNLLLSFFYFAKFDDDGYADRNTNRALKEYLEIDLPKNAELSEPLRAAIASQIHLEEARLEMRPPEGPFGLMFRNSEDDKAVRKHLKTSMKAYPANRSAYKTYVDWLETKLENDRLTKPEREPILDEEAQVMKDWAAALPEDVKPRLWLVDYLLENEQMDEAKPHVDWLAGARQDDPRVRATPWKWQLLEAMRLCRRKAWLADVPARLDEAERLWPAWLSRDWLPYLRAAVTLRAGHTEEFEAQRQRICEEAGRPRDSLADACMMLGAAQHMRVPAANLKPLRASVDQTVKRLSKLDDEELLDVSGFFWDLHRTELVYPAYRMHGGKIANELFACLRKNPNWVIKHLDDERVPSAILLCSHLRFLDDGYDLKLPHWYSKPAVREHPMFAAAKLNAVLKLRYRWRVPEYRELGSQVREMASSQRDAYYRYWFASMADELDDLAANDSSGPFGFSFNAFANSFGEDDEDEYDDEEDEDLGFDPDCNCRACTAARWAYEASRR